MTSTTERRSMRIVWSLLLAAAAAAPRSASACPAQQAAGGTISGSVIDATTSAPLARATVTLASTDGFAVFPDPNTSSLALARTVTTTAAGTYRFTNLAIGAYRLRIQRVGYEPATVDVRLSDSGTSPLSVGLVVLPVRLRAVEVRAHDSAVATDDPLSAPSDDSRLAAAHARQQAFLSTDARELTSTDIAESATVGGSDIFRALERLPGVTQLDDWSAEFWVRGNRWDHNRVYFDGLPLFDPVGALGRTSGVSADAIGGAFLHPGVRPVSLSGDGATLLDLRSRPATGRGDWRGSAELTQFGASGSVERERADGRAGFVATALHSVGDWLPHSGYFTDPFAGRRHTDAQATLREDVDLGDGTRLTMSGLLTRDARTFRNAAGGDDENQNWRNAGGRFTLVTPVGSVATSHTVGFAHFTTSTNRTLEIQDSLIASPITSYVDYVALNGRVGPLVADHDATTAGYDLVGQRSVTNGTHDSFTALDSAHLHARRVDQLTYGSLWIDNRTALGDRVTLENGVRLDLGGAAGVDAVRPGGSAQVLFALSPDTRLSAGANRVHQYVQGIDLPLLGQGQTLPTSWLVSGRDVPVMTVDNAMAGVERWVGTGVLVAANAYLRRTTGAIASDPTPGPLTGRPLFVDATESASGVEVSARKLIGGATGLLAYSYGNARMTASGLSFPAPADRTHALDAAMSAHLGSFNLGGAYTLTSGAPYTRIVFGSSPTTVREAPNARRLPTYESFDVSLDYTHAFRGVALIAFAGVQNLFDRKNSTWYEVSGYCESPGAQPTPSPQCRDHDLLEAPVKRAPTIGLRIVTR